MASHDHRLLSKTPASRRIPTQVVDEVLLQAPFVVIPGIKNFRDISNATTASSHFSAIVRPGLIFRSASPKGLTDESKAILSTLGIRTMYDLRGRREIALNPIPAIDGIEYVSLPYAIPEEPPREDMSAAENALSRLVVQTMTCCLEHLSPIYKRVFEHIRDMPEKSLLIFCSAGKNRTDVLTALILRLAGSSSRATIHDYRLSRIGLEAESQFYGREDPVPVPLLLRLSVYPRGMFAFLKSLDAAYGGAEGYLKTRLGFSDQDVETMRKNLRLEDPVEKAA